MLDRQSAMKMAYDYISTPSSLDGIEVVILDNQTIEKEYGWIFFYNSKKFLETGSFRDRIAGNSPVLVERETGKIHELGTANPVSESIKKFELERFRT
jgi:hypothetical protein